MSVDVMTVDQNLSPVLVGTVRLDSDGHAVIPPGLEKLTQFGDPSDGERFLQTIVQRLQGTHVWATPASLREKSLQIKSYDPSEPRDDHGRWTSGGGSAQPPAHDNLVNGFGRPLSPLESKIPNRDPVNDTQHFLAQVTPGDEHALPNSDSPNSITPPPATIGGVGTVSGSGILRDNAGMELYAFATDSQQIAQGIANAQANLDVARKDFVTVGQDLNASGEATNPVDNQEWNKGEVGVQALNSAEAELGNYYRGAPPDHPVSEAWRNYNAASTDMNHLYDYGPGSGTPLTDDQFAKFRAAYAGAITNLSTVAMNMEHLATTVSAEQISSGGRYSKRS